MSLALSAVSLVVRARRLVRSSKERGPAPVSPKLLELCDVTTEQVDGCDVITLVPKTGASGIEVIYTHGGSYVHPIGGFHWQLIQSILERTGATITVPLYALGPVGSPAAAYSMLDAVYAIVTARAGDAHPVFLVGDSAGGGLALGQAIRYRDDGAPPPAGVIVFSPWVELRMSNPAIPDFQELDPMLTQTASIAAATLWTDDPDDPLASPINDSLAGLPPLSVYQGGREIFLPDVETFVNKARAAGTEVHYWLAPKAFHVWVAIRGLPEAKAALDDVAERMLASR